VEHSRIQRRTVLAAGVGLAAGLSRRAWADTNAERPVGVETALAEEMDRWGVPSVSYAVVEDGHLVAAQARGVVRAGDTEKATPDTLYQAASLSKSVAAAVALVLVQRGQLVLDDDVNRRLTSWRLPESPLSRGRPVTLRRLLGMTAGIDVPGFPGYPPGAPLPTLEQILDGRPPANSPPVSVEAPPGTAETYSGGGYEIVEALVGDAAGKRFAKVATATVLRPLGMAASGFGRFPPSAQTAQAAQGHTLEGLPLPGGWNSFPEHAAAGLWSTAPDLARFLIGLIRSVRAEPGALLGPEMIRAMLTPVDGFGYGLGGALRGTGRACVFMKSGHNFGYMNYMLFFPETGQGAIVLTNSEQGEHLRDPLLRSLAMAYGWPDFGALAD
jgi:CubicO group peptidase (beta-lactamase class C family)